MKFRLGTMFITACIALAACSDRMTEENGFEGNEGGIRVYGAKVALVLPSEAGGGRSVMTKAAEEPQEPEFDDGNENEYKVTNKNVYFVFLDDNYHTMSVVSGNDVQWTTQFPNAGNGNGSVTQQGTVQIEAARRPAYLVVLCNVDDELETALKNNTTSISYETLQEALAPTTIGAGQKDFWLSHVANAESGFLMTNSTYFDPALDQSQPLAPTNKNTVKAVKVDEKNIVDVDEINEAEAIEVYVERVVAKTTLKISEKNAPQPSIGNGSYYKLTDGTDASKHEFGVKLLGWTLNATNKSFMPLKKIEGIERDWTAMAGGFFMNSTGNHRSYWAVDGNYNGGKYGANGDFNGATVPDKWNGNDLNYYSINEAKTGKNTSFDGSTASYCLENTMNAGTATNKAAITHMLIVGQYVDSDGSANDGNVYRYAGKIYTEEQLGAYIKTELEKRGYENASSVQNTDFQFDTATTWKDRADVKITKIYYTGEASGLDEFKKTGSGDLKTSVFGWNTLWVYPDGYCYYTVPIRHFIGSNNNGQVGYYGMVRNHWYSVTVTIEGFGEPASPEKPVIPDDTEESEYALKAEIKVQAWAKREYGSTVGGETTWE